MTWRLPVLKRKDGEALIWGHHDRAKRHWAYIGDHCFSLEFGRVKGSRWAELRHGYGYVEGIGVAAGFSWGFWLTWKLPYSWMRRIPGWPKDGNDRSTGFHWRGDGVGELQFIHDPMGDHWSRTGMPSWWRRWLQPGHRTLKVWDHRWVLGRDKYTKVSETEKSRMLIVCGEFPGDEYVYDVHIESVQWKNRFRTKRRRFWEFKAVEGKNYDQRAGKGENSWDLDDDGIYGCSFDVDEIDKAAGGRGTLTGLHNAMRDRILADRRRYGMPHRARGSYTSA